jgi:hypothetical protein
MAQPLTDFLVDARLSATGVASINYTDGNSAKRCGQHYIDSNDIMLDA